MHQRSGTRMDAHRRYHKQFMEHSQGILVLEQILASKVSLVECFPVSAVVLVVILPQPASQPLHVAVRPGRPMPTTIPTAERQGADYEKIHERTVTVWMVETLLLLARGVASDQRRRTHNLIITIIMPTPISEC